jgi:uncharacterized membrane protein
MVDDKLEQDELQRTANYEAIKSEVKAEVGGEIAVEARRATPAEVATVDEIAGDMRHKAIREVAETERDVERGRVIARISQVIDYIFLLIYSLLTIRFLLALFAARPQAGFTRFIRGVTDPLYAPFKGVVGSLESPDGVTLSFPLIVCIISYAILHLAINGLLRLFVHRKTKV